MNLNVIYILWLRQIKRYVRSKARMIGSLGQPLLFLVALGFGFGPIYQKAGNGNYVEFIGPGVVAMGIIFTGIFFGMEIIWDKQFGFLKETLVAPVSRLTIMIGRTIGGATVATMQGLIILLLATFVGFRVLDPFMLPMTLMVMALVAIFFSALGTAIASLLDDMHAFPMITNFLIMPMFFLSGAIFPLKNLPEFIDIITKFNPLSYGIDALHFTLLGESQFGFAYDLSILSAITVLVLVIGACLFSRIEV